MFWTIAADERAALQFEDLASALDAGLPLATLGGDPAAGDQVVHGILQRRRVRLDATESAVLQAAWRAGRAVAALRSRAQQRRDRAQFRRELLTGLRYPLAVLAMLQVTSILTIAVVGPWFAIGVALGIAAAALAAWRVANGLRAGDERWLRLPVVGPIARDLGELPYLETLAALYGAGIPLATAHRTAVATVPFAGVRARLQIADAAVQSGRKLAEGLHEALALHQETRALLATGEQAGQLEDALARALVRRRSVAVRAAGSAARLFGAIVYGATMVTIAWIVVSFWTNFYGAVLRR